MRLRQTRVSFSASRSQVTDSDPASDPSAPHVTEFVAHSCRIIASDETTGAGPISARALDGGGSGSQPSPAMMPRMRVAKASRAKGLVITCMPGPRWPWLSAAFSA
jgi:hypothetical protein